MEHRYARVDSDETESSYDSSNKQLYPVVSCRLKNSSNDHDNDSKANAILFLPSCSPKKAVNTLPKNAPTSRMATISPVLVGLCLWKAV